LPVYWLLRKGEVTAAVPAQAAQSKPAT